MICSVTFGRNPPKKAVDRIIACRTVLSLRKGIVWEFQVLLGRLSSVGFQVPDEFEHSK